MAKTHFPIGSGGYRYAAHLTDYFDGATTGNVFFVNSVTGTDAVGYGFSPDAPFASINFAVTQCAATNGDRIYAMPGHVETVTAAGGCALGVAGVQVIGLGNQGARPKFSYTTAAAASVTVTAAGCSITNCLLDMTGVASVANGINVTAADFTLSNCRVLLATSTNQAVIGLLTSAAASRLVVDNCQFYGSNTAGVSNAINLIGGDGIVIQNSLFQGAFSGTQGAIYGVTTDTTNLFVAHNKINNLTAGATKAIVLTASSTGMILENKMQILSGTAPITGAAMSWVGANYYAATIAVAGTLI